MTHRVVVGDFGIGRISRLIIGEYAPDGTVELFEVDDVIDVKPWGEGWVLRMQTRDPVIVRKDGTCEMLVTS